MIGKSKAKKIRERTEVEEKRELKKRSRKLV